MEGIILTCIMLYCMACFHEATPFEGTANYSLVGGVYDSEGQVEVILNGTQVASICDSLWGIEEANVVCKSLNYTGADLAYVSRFFSGDPGNSSVYNDVTCTGLEDHLLQCNYTYDEDSNCPYSGKGAGVICTAHGSLRLADGTVPGEGRVEILGESGEWGTICDDGWDGIDARVACRQLGFPDAVGAVVNNAYPDYGPVFGRGSGPIYLDGVACYGVERHLIDCQVEKGWEIHDCTHGEDAGVICDTKLIRLEDGTYPNLGRVEVYYGGAWGTICPSSSWNIEAAHVACKELGFPFGALEATSVHGGGRQVLLDEVNCLGNEYHLKDCQSLGWAKVQSCTPYGSSNQYTAGVICHDPANVVRLLSGSTSYEGIVEYRFGSEPGLICDPDWSDLEANVTCRQLGYQFGRSEKVVQLGSVTGLINSRNYQCNGTEQHLGECQFSMDEACADEINHIAQVVCGPPKDYDLRMAGSDYTEQGRIEMYWNNEWGAITDNLFSRNEHQAVCRQLGYEYATPFSYSTIVFERGSEKIIIDDLDCQSYHNKITDCRIVFSGNEPEHTHDDALEVICVPYVSVSNHPIRLINEKGQANRDYGRIEIFHDGRWGSVCDTYFDDADLLCRDLGHSDVRYAGRLDLNSYNIPDSSWLWFSLITCDFVYGVDVQYLFQCRFTPWGYDDQSWCRSGIQAGMKCIDNIPITTVETSTHTVVNPSQTPSNRDGLVEWEIMLIALAFIVTFVCMVCLCFHRHRNKTTDESNHVLFTSSTNNDRETVTVVSSPPSFVPPSPSATELPPSYNSVIEDTQPTAPSTDDVNPSDNDANGI